MSNADLILSKMIEEVVAGYNKNKRTGHDALAHAIQILDRRISEEQHKVKMPLWVEICEKHRLSESEWSAIIADMFRMIAHRCQVLEVNEWLEAEADLAEFQHE